MLIVDQQKKFIVNTENMISICKEENIFEDGLYCITAIYDARKEIKSYYTLGKYSSMEKANSVMRQILDAYGNDWKVFEMPEDK